MGRAEGRRIVVGAGIRWSAWWSYSLSCLWVKGPRSSSDFLDPAVLEMLTAGIELRDEGGLWYTGDASGIVGAGSRASQGLDFEELWNPLQDNRKGAGWPDRPCIASGVRKLSRR